MIHQIFLSAAEEVVVKPSVLGTLGIDWKLFIAQLFNFAVVLFVFWKWVVGPLGKTLTDRQNKIESGLKNAQYMEEEKKKFEDWRQQEMKKVRTEADHILRMTNDTANKIKQETIVEAQKEATNLVTQAKATIESEKIQTLAEIKQDVATLVVAASEKILRTKLDSKKDQELIHESIHEVK
jgi:F-type H+-transporting ATPase subunit b